MKYYIAQIEEYNGEYTYQHVYLFSCKGDFEKKFYKYAKTFYGSKVEIEEDGSFSQLGGEVNWKPHHFKEISYQIYSELIGFLPYHKF